ncbi:MAG: choice-of-anchor B family protein [Lewinellaceae bacterium]|nr:choice-of-anchor B family protein [Lewinellaceae bacterium]
MLSKSLPACLFFLFFGNVLFAQTSSPGLQLIGHLPYDTATLAGCWHYVDSSGTEYALVGTSKGLSIVDLSNPTQPFQRFAVPGISNNWREVKTWGGFAYVGTEASNSGVTIIDLRQLPDTVLYKTWQGDGVYENQIVKSHALATADGYLYLFGGIAGNMLSNGAVICSLSDPWNPHVVGYYSNAYVHDGYIRDNTLWTSEIYNGWFGVVDITDKTNPQLLATQPTPGAFNHNTWLSDDSQTLFAADEKLNAPLAAFDVSDLDNIKLLDVYYCSQDPSREVHNVRVFNDFLINPSYGGQLTIVDAHRPENLIETAWAVMGNSLVWDADPYLPSGIVFATAKNEGLFIYQPNYTRAAYLEGTVTDAQTGMPLNNARVFVENTIFADTTKQTGQYKTGASVAGIFSIRAEKPGYETQIIPDITLTAGELAIVDIALQPIMADAVAQQSKGSGVRVTPSPFRDRIVVEIPEDVFRNLRNVSITVYDLKGQTILDAPLQHARQTFDVGNNIPTGPYVLLVQHAGGMFPPIRIYKG